MSDLEKKISSLKEKNRILSDQVMEASIVGNITELLNSASTTKDLLSTLIYSLNEMDIFEKIVYLEVDKKRLELIPTASHGISEEKLKSICFPISFMGGDFVDALFTNTQFVIENGIEEKDEFSTKLNCDRYIVMPLSGRNEYPFIEDKIMQKINSEDERRIFQLSQPGFPVAGLFVFDITHLDDVLYAQEISIVNQLIHTTGIIYENLHLMGQLKLYHDRIERELEQAKKVQLGLLPSTLPSEGKINAACKYIPQEKVSGDYYDLFPLPNDNYGIIIADVSGHGAPSALVMAMAKMLLLTNASEKKSPSATLSIMNEMLVNLVNTNKFITVFYAVLDLKNSQLHYTSAGHCPVFLIDKTTEKLTSLESDGFFVGMFPDLGIQDHSIDIANDKRLVLFTDGITEAMNEKSEQYGEKRLAQSALRQLPLPPKKAVKMMLADQKNYLGDLPFDDDITLLVVDF
jgi:serine phosphatase RsbU (regulator of sigma subunit)